MTGPVVLEKMFEIVDDDGRMDERRTDGRRLDGYTKSASCEPLAQVSSKA